MKELEIKIFAFASACKYLEICINLIVDTVSNMYKNNKMKIIGWSLQNGTLCLYFLFIIIVMGSI